LAALSLQNKSASVKNHLFLFAILQVWTHCHKAELKGW